ncbi:MAG: TolC family protein [Verrucomicrobiales bacterium]|nr:TolC family protein [Verrucomicrobiales bacterium]
MKHLLPFTTITTLVVLAISVSAGTADDPATNNIEALTLEQAWDVAERLQPELAEAKALIDAAEARAKQAGLFPNPAAIARMESARFDGRTTGQAEYLAGISQPIPLGNRLSKARQAELLERARRSKELEVHRRNLRRRVHSAFATALYQEQAFEKQNEIAASVEKVAATTKARVDAGDAAREDLARAEMELVRAKVELRRSEAMREHAMVELKAAMGDPHLSIRTLAGKLEATFEIPALETLAAELSTHPEVALAATEVRARQARVDLAKAERIPDVRAELLYRRLEASKESSFDVGVSIPLPLFDRNQGRLRKARAEVAAAEARSRSMQNSLRVRLHEAHARLTGALANSRDLKNEVLPRAETVLKAVEARYSAGDISLNEAMPVRRDWAAMQLSYLEALRDVMQAWVEVRALALAN